MCNEMCDLTQREDLGEPFLLLLVSYTSTGLLSFLIGAPEHWLGVCRVLASLLVCNSTLLHITIIGIPGWVPTEVRQSELWADAHLRLI